MKRLYRVHEFAQLAGVTVKALHHYDRLGLLKPMRSDAGYRVYGLRDLERLEQIVALKFIGVPLGEIKWLLERDALGMAQALRLQRRVLEQKRRLLDQALKAIEEAESEMSGSGHAIRKIIEVIGLQTSTDFLKKYYSEEAWAKWRTKEHDWPSQETIDLLSDAERALGEAPESEQAQALVMRWVALRTDEAGGDPDVLVGLMKAWAARGNWPSAAAGQLAQFDLESIARFLHRAAAAYRKKYYSDEAWEKLKQETPEEGERRSLEWFDIYLEASGLLDEDPASDRAQELTARWMDLAYRSTGSDLELHAGALRAWADRQNWPPAIRELIASFHLEEISAFIGKARAVHEKKYYSTEAWEKRARLHPGQDIGARWRALYADAREALEDDPGTARAQELVRRWIALLEETTGGDPEIRRGATKAWQDRKNWPAWKQRQIAASRAVEISEFIGRAIDWPLRKYFDEESWAKRTDYWKELAPESLEQAMDRRATLFAEVKETLGENPAGERAQAIAARWIALRQSEGAGDPGVLGGAARAWADRDNWPLTLRLKEAAPYRMNLEDFEKVADFIDAAIEARG